MEWKRREVKLIIEDENRDEAGGWGSIKDHVGRALRPF